MALNAQHKPPVLLRFTPDNLDDDDVLEMVNAGQGGRSRLRPIRKNRIAREISQQRRDRSRTRRQSFSNRAVRGLPECRQLCLSPGPAWFRPNGRLFALGHRARDPLRRIAIFAATILLAKQALADPLTGHVCQERLFDCTPRSRCESAAVNGDREGADCRFFGGESGASERLRTVSPCYCVR